jgi:chromosome segregation ATPase
MTWMILLPLILIALLLNIIISAKSQNTIVRRVWRVGATLDSSITSLNAQMETLKKGLLTQNEALSACLKTCKELRTGLDSCIVQRQYLDNINDRLEKLVQAEIANLAKKGEANRTLRKRIADYKNMLDKTNHSLEIARTSRENAANLAALLREEIKEIRSFMEQQRLPTKMMTKRLDVHFKGRIPSEMYASAERELELRKRIRQPDDAA